nr:MAG TPA: hypothetical protein [Caudoviricetes sp.]
MMSPVFLSGFHPILHQMVDHNRLQSLHIQKKIPYLHNILWQYLAQHTASLIYEKCR